MLERLLYVSCVSKQQQHLNGRQDRCFANHNTGWLAGCNQRLLQRLVMMKTTQRLHEVISVDTSVRVSESYIQSIPPSILG